ncbi:MAG: DUF1801 domain-containing protein [Planctomycetaceae bacterium]|nr:DUF1801 domain-containing protein [Planctomycetaceae bacterium]
MSASAAKKTATAKPKSSPAKSVATKAVPAKASDKKVAAAKPSATAAVDSIDKYVAQFSSDVQAILGRIRQLIAKAAPEAQEAMKYQIPTFVLNGNLVHFAAFENHIGLYPTPSGIVRFQSELKPYKTAKGSIQFPLDKEIPFGLIQRIVEFRVEENRSKSKPKSRA